MPSASPVRHRSLCLRLLSSLVLLFFFAGAGPALHAAAEGNLLPAVGPTPAWVRALAWSPPSSLVVNPAGQDFLLVDQQTRVGTEEIYYHHVSQIVTEQGRSEAAQVSLHYDPSYQTLTIHQIDVVRGPEKFDRLDPTRIQVLQQERELDRQMYNGQRSAFVILDDVRVGDILDIAYTVRGHNPVFDGRFVDATSLGWSSPVRLQRYRLLVPKRRSVAVRTIANAPDLVSAHEVHDDEEDFIWTRKNIPILETEDRAPNSEYLYPFLDVSEFQTWREVVDWALPLYAEESASAPLLEALVTRIRAEAVSPEQQAIDALTFVQQEIRYLGIEMGAGSHRPSLPEEVLRRRFGDCKDKSRLLCALLNRLGHHAEPALVHSYRLEATHQRLPTPYAFNHVIVALAWKGQTVLLDPTLSYQRGDGLALRQIGRYGPYLRVAPGVTALEDADYQPADFYDLAVAEEFDAPDFGKPAAFVVTTTASGRSAEELRAYFATNTHDQIGRQYLDYYTRFYDGITREAPVEFSDSPRTNRIKLVERYVIPELFKLTQETTTWRAELQPIAIWDYVRAPSLVQRRLPFSISHPAKARETLTVRLPRDWSITPGSKTVDDRAFRFDLGTSLPTPRTVVLDHRWESRSSRVERAQIPEFAQHLQQVRQNLGYVLTWQETPARPAVTTPAGLNWPMIALVVALTAGAAAICWKLVRRRNPAPPPPPLLDPAPTAVDPYSHKGKSQRELNGLGGWLVLVGFGVVVRPFAWLYAIIESRHAYFDLGTWHAITRADSPSYNANFFFVCPLELAFTLLMFLYGLLLNALFFRRSYLFPRTMQIHLVVAVGYNVFALWDNALLGQKLGFEQYQVVVQTLIAAAIWIPYFQVSRRVKATFTR